MLRNKRFSDGIFWFCFSLSYPTVISLAPSDPDSRLGIGNVPSSGKGCPALAQAVQSSVQDGGVIIPGGF